MNPIGELRDIGYDQSFVEPLTGFGNNLFESIKNPQSNVIFSPLSIYLCLSMFKLGVRHNTSTDGYMNKALGYSEHLAGGPKRIHESNSKFRSYIEQLEADPDRSIKFTLQLLNYAIVNGIPLKKEYTDESKKYYGTAVKQILNNKDKVEVLDEINGWAKRAGFSDEVLNEQQIDRSHVILLNAIRLESPWFDQFKQINMQEVFYNHGRPDGLVKNSMGLSLDDSKVTFFELTKSTNSTQFGYLNNEVRSLNPEYYDDLAELDFRVIMIRLYQGISYTIIEPLNTQTGEELEILEGKLIGTKGQNRMMKLTALLDDADGVMANLEMPMFSFQQDIDLKSHLKNIGLEGIFNHNCSLDTRDMTDDGLFVSDVKHKALIEVSEKGIKAAAVTVMSLRTTAFLQTAAPIDLKVKKPFMFLVRLHKVPLFLGHLVKV